MSEWISVKDGLPIFDDPVLAFNGKHIEKAFRVEGSLFKPCEWYWTYYDYMEWDGVTHWMPLPNPPRSDE